MKVHRYEARPGEPRGSWSWIKREMLVDARLTAGLGVPELAARIDLGERTLRRIVRGDTDANDTTVDRWLKECGTRVVLLAAEK